MSRFEDSLRDALDAEVDPAGGPPIDDVRRGAARRRRNRRTTGVVVATAALVAGVAGAGALVGNNEAGPPPSPEPATSPSGGGTEPTEVREVEGGPDGSLLAAGYDDACGCTEVHRWDGEDWELLHRFDEQVDQLAMAPDGHNGWAATETTGLWATHDGGDTWQQADVPDAGAQPMFQIAATPYDVLVLADGRAWRATVGSDEFAPVALPQGNYFAPHAVGDAVVLDAAFDEESVPEVPQVSRDVGEAWTGLPYPCDDEHRRLTAAGGALYALCPSPSGTVVHRSLDLVTWEVFGTVSSAHLTPLTENAVMATGGGDQMLTEAGAAPIEFPLPADAVRDAVALADGYYLATARGVAVSSDQGRTWQRVDGEPLEDESRTVEPSGEEPGEPVSSVPPAGSVPTTIPDEYPLADGMPDAADFDQGSYVAPTRDLAELAYQIRFEACDTAPELPAAQDRLTTQATGIEYGLTRELTTYADANQAIAAVEALVNLYRNCPTQSYDGVPGETVRTAERTDFGGESWVLASTQGVHLLQTHVIRVGLAVLLIQESSEGGGGPDAASDRQRYLDEMTSTAQEPIAAMCHFTADGC